MRNLLLVSVLLITFAFKSDCIWKGEEATWGDFTYVVSFRFQQHQADDREVVCGGSIITEHFIVTSAFCAKSLDDEKLFTYVGSIDLTQGGKNFTIDEIRIHEEYNATTQANDIAVIRTAKPIELSPGKITKIRLPTVDHPAKGGIKANVSGYGQIIETPEVSYISSITFI